MSQIVLVFDLIIDFDWDGNEVIELLIQMTEVMFRMRKYLKLNWRCESIEYKWWLCQKWSKIKEGVRMKKAVQKLKLAIKLSRGEEWWRTIWSKFKITVGLRNVKRIERRNYKYVWAVFSELLLFARQISLQLSQTMAVYFAVDNEKEEGESNYQKSSYCSHLGTQVQVEILKDFEGNQPYFWKKNRNIVDSTEKERKHSL